MQYALCLDTLGTEQQISAEEVSILMDAAKAAAAYRFRCDTYSVYQQATVRDGAGGESGGVGGLRKGLRPLLVSDRTCGAP